MTITIGLLILLVAVVAILVHAARQPDTFRVERSARIAAPAAAIIPLIDDFHAWSRWSPWEKMDPAMRKTYAGAPRGVGAAFEWEGNSKVGKGRMEITESSPARIAASLHFIKPFEGRNVAEFTLAPDGEATRVTWAMSGRQAFIPKLMGIVVDMDRMIGGNFEKGLADLKAIAERGS